MRSSSSLGSHRCADGWRVFHRDGDLGGVRQKAASSPGARRTGTSRRTPTTPTRSGRPARSAAGRCARSRAAATSRATRGTSSTSTRTTTPSPSTGRPASPTGRPSASVGSRPGRCSTPSNAWPGRRHHSSCNRPRAGPGQLRHELLHDQHPPHDADGHPDRPAGHDRGDADGVPLELRLRCPRRRPDHQRPRRGVPRPARDLPLPPRRHGAAQRRHDVRRSVPRRRRTLAHHPGHPHRARRPGRPPRSSAPPPTSSATEPGPRLRASAAGESAADRRSGRVEDSRPCPRTFASNAWPIAVVADVLVVLVFAAVGRSNHHESAGLAGHLAHRVAVPPRYGARPRPQRLHPDRPAEPARRRTRVAVDGRHRDGRARLARRGAWRCRSSSWRCSCSAPSSSAGGSRWAGSAGGRASASSGAERFPEGRWATTPRDGH